MVVKVVLVLYRIGKEEEDDKPRKDSFLGHYERE